jgi:drug/metabolite transporter (DMT)-like permease
MLGALLATILFSFSAVFATRTARLMGGTEANFWRLSLASLGLGLYTLTLHSDFGGPAFPLFFISGVIGFGVGDVALFQALPRLGSRLTVLVVHCLAAPLGAALEWLWLGTTLTWAELGYGALILMGVVMAIAPDKRVVLPRRTLWIGASFGALAALGQGGGAVLSRKAFEVGRLANDCPDGLAAASQRSVGGLIVAGICLLVVKRAWLPGVRQIRSAAEPDLVASVRVKWRGAWAWVLLNALTGPALGVGCFQWALKTTPTGVVLPIVALTPLMIVPLAFWLEGEKPSRRSLLGGALAVAGAVGLAGGRG